MNKPEIPNGNQMELAHHRHDISDETWQLLELHLPGRKGAWDGNPRIHNAVFWILRSGAPCKDLPPDYGDWNNIHRRFCRWRDRGVWKSLFELLVDEPDYEWLTIDADHIKVHQHARQEPEAAIKRWVAQKGFNATIHLTVDAHGMPVGMLIIEGTTADCSQAAKLIESIDAALLPDTQKMPPLFWLLFIFAASLFGLKFNDGAI